LLENTNKPFIYIFNIMKFLSMKKVAELEGTGLTKSQIAKYLEIDIFDFYNFLHKHKGRTGTYPVDGSRKKEPVKPKHEYPENNALANKLKTKSIKALAIELNVPYEALRAHINKQGIRYVRKATRVSKITNPNNEGFVGPEAGIDLFNKLMSDPTSAVSRLKK